MTIYVMSAIQFNYEADCELSIRNPGSVTRRNKLSYSLEELYNPPFFNWPNVGEAGRPDLSRCTEFTETVFAKLTNIYYMMLPSETSTVTFGRDSEGRTVVGHGGVKNWRRTAVYVVSEPIPGTEKAIEASRKLLAAALPQAAGRTKEVIESLLK